MIGIFNFNFVFGVVICIEWGDFNYFRVGFYFYVIVFGKV